jgi:ferric-dicitrate binding protein FerR (iron transport regulator)
MIERDDIEAQLQEYVQSLPGDRRLARDRSARRQRLVPALRAHVTRERKRVQRRRALARAAGLIALGGAAATAFWLMLPRMAALRVTTTAAAPSNSVSAPVVPALAQAAALTVIDGSLWLRGETGAHALRAGESVPLSDRIAFEAPADSRVRVRISDIASMTLAPGSRARPMAPAGPPSSVAIALERGRARFEVDKLRGDRRFHVMTPDADVEVRGTVFDVALSPPAGAPTCVSVEEGLVQVAKATRTRLLARGESWDCDVASDPTNGAPATESTPAAGASASRRRGTPHVATAGARAKTDRRRESVRAGETEGAAPGAPSDLRVQNEIFQAALSAELAGRTDEATGLYRQLLARAPGGPLAAQARANLEALAGTGR